MHRLFLLLFTVLAACGGDREQVASLSTDETLGGTSPAGTRGFARAMAPRQFIFPDDHYAHPDFRNEWWYLTGSLAGDDGREFGYQLTFFRIALAAEWSGVERESAWATRQVWMAHAALTDIDGQQHYHDQRLARGGAGLAGNSRSPFRIWLDDWQIRGEDDVFPWQITAPAGEFGISLRLTPERDIVLQGDQGLSQKSQAAGNASYYYSITRLATHGSIRVRGADYRVRGLSWLDREWSTSALGPDQAGWDWFSLQLNSGEDLMYYRLRRKDGGVDPLSRGTLTGSQGERKTLAPGDVALTATEYWEDEGGTRYPIRWRMALSDPERSWIIVAAVDDQLMETVVRYWEGAVNVLDPATGSRVGRGYLEMTGY